jgi:hydroxyacylglutathione hydrolase
MLDQSLILQTREVGPWPMNSYALICPETGQSVLIDPGADPENLEKMLVDSTPVAILLTHSHADHIGALSQMRRQLAVPLMAYAGPHEGDLGLSAEYQLDTGDSVDVGNYKLDVYYTPGHISDQICFFLRDDHRVIVGDTIFEGGPGKTWSVEGFQQTLNTIRNVVMKWPDNTVCFPGHGPSFRLGDKRTSINAFLAKDHGNFFGDATWEM